MIFSWTGLAFLYLHWFLLSFGYDVPEVDSCYENIYLEDHILVDKLSALNLDTHTLPGKCIYKITSRRERSVCLLLFFTDLDIPPNSTIEVINGPPTTGHLYASQPRMDGVSWRTVLYRSSGQTISITVDLGNYDDSVYHYAGFSVTYWPSNAWQAALVFPKFPTTERCQSLNHLPIHGGQIRQSLMKRFYSLYYISNLHCIWSLTMPVDVYQEAQVFARINSSIWRKDVQLIIRNGKTSLGQILIDIGGPNDSNQSIFKQNDTLVHSKDGLYIDLRVFSENSISYIDQYLHFSYGVYIPEIYPLSTSSSTECRLGDNYEGWRCLKDNWCIPATAVSDGIQHCGDQSDESIRQIIHNINVNDQKYQTREEWLREEIVQEWMKAVRIVAPIGAVAFLACLCVCYRNKRQQCLGCILSNSSVTTVARSSTNATRMPAVQQPLLPVTVIVNGSSSSSSRQRIDLSNTLESPSSYQNGHRHYHRHRHPSSARRTPRDTHQMTLERVNSLPSLQYGPSNGNLSAPVSSRQRSSSSSNLPPSYTDVMSSSQFPVLNTSEGEPAPPAYESVCHIPPAVSCVRPGTTDTVECDINEHGRSLNIPRMIGRNLSSTSGQQRSASHDNVHLPLIPDIQPPAYADIVPVTAETAL